MSDRGNNQRPPGRGGYSPIEIIELPNILINPGDPIPPPVELIAASTPLETCPCEPVEPKPGLPTSRARRRAERVLHRMNRLPEADRQFLELIAFRGMTPKQVAKALGVSRKDVYIRYGELMEKLGRPPVRRFPPPPRMPQPPAPKSDDGHETPAAPESA